MGQYCTNNPKKLTTETPLDTNVCLTSDSIIHCRYCAVDQRWRLKNMLAAIMFSAIAIGFMLTNLSPASAQGAKKAAKGTKKDPAAQNIEITDLGLPNLGFSAESDVDDHAITDPDETPDGRQRLKEVSDRARQIYFEHADIQRERRPIATKRDVLVGELNTLLAVIVQSQNTIIQNNGQINVLQGQIAVSKDPGLIAQQNNLRAANVQLGVIVSTNQDVIDRRKPTLDALNIEIRPLNERLRKLWEELNACRKQWLEIRVPQEKFARGEFENLKRVIDDWARIDGLWPQAFCWGAICAHEVGDYEIAWDLIEKADKLRIDIFQSKKAWSQIEALRGLVSYNIPALRHKSDGWIKDALAGLDKKTDWETYYIVARAVGQKPGQGKRAEAFLNTTLKIRSRCLSAKYQLAVMQSNPASGITNLAEGTKQLEELWTMTGKRSWRIGFSLAMAYKASDRKSEADSILDKVLDIAPDSEHPRLKKAFG